MYFQFSKPEELHRLCVSPKAESSDGKSGQDSVSQEPEVPLFGQASLLETLNPKPYTLNPKPQTLNPKP